MYVTFIQVIIYSCYMTKLFSLINNYYVVISMGTYSHYAIKTTKNHPLNYAKQYIIESGFSTINLVMLFISQLVLNGIFNKYILFVELLFFFF